MNKNDDRMSREGLIFCIAPKDYEKFDLRSSKPIYYEIDKDKSPVDYPGFVFQEYDKIEFKGKNTLEYFTPNNIGVLLSITNKSLEQAKEIFNKKIDPSKHHHALENVKNDRLEFLISKSRDIYDYIEIVQTCIVFSYTSLETFANLSIPDNYKYSMDVKTKGTIEVFDKIAIEKWLPLKKKLCEILVDIYEIEDITQSSFWSHFVKLEQYRHDIIHQKSIRRTTFYKEYFNRDIFDVCSCAEEIINFFHKQYSKKGAINPLWPWLVSKENYFVATKFEGNDLEVFGNLDD